MIIEKLLFAPIATISHEAMRRFLAHYSVLDNGENACDEYYTEMIHASSLLAGGMFEPYYVRTGPDKNRIVWQLTDSRSTSLAAAAREVCALGGIGVDINMGCSAPEIVRQGAGVAWMLKERQQTEAMMRLVRDAMDETARTVPGSARRLSVKMRLGGEQFTQENLNDFGSMLAETGVSRIVLHPRTAKQRFKRQPDWETAARFTQHMKKNFGNSVSVCANGDITDGKSALAVLHAGRGNPGDDETNGGFDGLMIGRAAIEHPWVFAQIRCALSGTAFTEQRYDLLALGLEFLDNLTECQPPEFYLTRAQRFFAWFTRNLKFGTYLQNKIANAKDIKSVRKIFTDYFTTENERFVVVSGV